MSFAIRAQPVFLPNTCHMVRVVQTLNSCAKAWLAARGFTAATDFYETAFLPSHPPSASASTKSMFGMWSRLAHVYPGCSASGL